ncbi:MAG: hypothetical protein GX282_08270 [Campylobacteraceae bacterium]|nr:hypothetical protein [Campylobacteraceae bacterium]
MFKTSTSRLPTDHFISGALFGGMSAAAFEFYGKDNDTATKVKNISKFALQGGIAAYLSISASNKLVQRDYLRAGVDIALGAGLIIATEKILKTKKVEVKEVK